MASNNVWGGHLELAAIAKHYNVNIFVHQLNVAPTCIEGYKVNSIDTTTTTNEYDDFDDDVDDDDDDFDDDIDDNDNDDTTITNTSITTAKNSIHLVLDSEHYEAILPIIKSPNISKNKYTVDDSDTLKSICNHIQHLRLSSPESSKSSSKSKTKKRLKSKSSNSYSKYR